MQKPPPAAGLQNNMQTVRITGKIKNRQERIVAGVTSPMRLLLPVAVFVVTTLVFSLPFLLEIVLNCISFPLKATGDLANWSIYDEEYIETTKNFLLYPIYRVSPYLYAVVETLRFGATMGLLAAATTTLSALVRVKFRVVLLLPVFLLLQLSAYLSQFFDVYWANYVTLFHGEPRNDLVFTVVILFLLVFVILGTLLATGKDWRI